ncbi:dihydrolipoyl dehydrogenase [Novosphingobium sp. RD2P27]|uniref:Dihydrolipoyl dehydrogenase n=1 Tax=Novosphingobium kalidii TaxID=3230299 RepID=A0ABV2CXL6_9SPHN
MANVLQCDVAVIGAGTAGLAAERAARKNGASTLLIDPEFKGTTCATVGCMPSKLLIAAAKEAHGIGRAGLFGIEVEGVWVDGPAVLRRVRNERDRFARLTRESSIGELPQDVTIRARARFDGPNRLMLDDGRAIEAHAIVIATGSAPVLPPPFAALGEAALTSDTVFELADLPKRLAVIGSGAIGLELAQAFAHLGVRVSLFDKSRNMAKLRCPKVHASLREIIERDLSLHLGVEVSPDPAENGVRLRWTGDASGETTFDKVLVAVGRRPRLEGLALDKTGLELDDHGVPLHDRATMRCGDSAIFLAGDVAADLPLLHEASHDGAIAGRNAAAFPAPIETTRSTLFSITFTDPPLATIGEAEADGAITGTADYADQGRARVEGRNEGVLTLYAAAPDGRLIGADLIAPAGEHLAHMLAWAIQREVTATELLEMPFYHPTVEEGLKHALRTICAARPIPLPQDQDTGAPAGA